MNHPQFQSVSAAELRAVQGGSFFSWLGDAVAKVVSVFESISNPWT